MPVEGDGVPDSGDLVTYAAHSLRLISSGIEAESQVCILMIIVHKFYSKCKVDGFCMATD
jgi:hypothetical protein